MRLLILILSAIALVSLPSCSRCDFPDPISLTGGAPATGGSDGTGGVELSGGSGGFDPTGGVSTEIHERPRKAASLGMNLAALSDWSTERPFIDLMKSARYWLPDRVDAYTDERVQRDSDGWIVRNDTGANVNIYWLTNTAIQAPLPFENHYRVRWQGTGTVGVAHGTVVESSGDHEMQVTTTKNIGALVLSDIDPNDHLRDISVVPIDLVDRFDAGEVFNPLFLDTIRDFRVLRFMQWARTNDQQEPEVAQRVWGDRPTPSTWSYAEKGPPIEVMVRLANEVNADPWFTMPHLAESEYVGQFASLVRGSLAPQLVPYVEFSNEVWNWQFVQASWARDRAVEEFGVEGNNGWVQYNGVMAARTCDIWRGVYGSDYPHCVIGLFPSYTALAPSTLDCPLWSGGPCYAHGIDSASITSYFSGCLHYSQNEAALREWMTLPDGGVEIGLEQALDGRHFQCTSTVEGLRAMVGQHVAFASERGLSVTGYEGGSHVTANGSSFQSDADFVEFHGRVNSSTGMGDLYDRHFDAWREAGGGLLVVYQDIEAGGLFGYFGALNWLGQEPTPRWSSVQRYNAMPCWWEGCR